MVYQWNRFKYSVDANEVGAEIEAIEAENGEVTNKSVVDRARDKKNVMHGLFEWNDKIAGEKYREHQAGQIIHSLMIVTEEKEPTRAFMNIEIGAAPCQTGRFVCIDKALSNPDTRGNVLANAMNELRAFRKKYETLTELSELFAEIDKTIAMNAEAKEAA